LPRTGVNLQNRGISFSLNPKARNPLRPGRRPFHTLNPPLTVFDDGRVLSYGSMGGDGQPQFQAQVMTRILFGEGLAGAVEAPRFLFGKTWGDATTTLKLEPRFDSRLFEQLEKAGHEIEIFEAPYVSRVGHAGALMRSLKGTVEATHDPRSDGGADGL
jgi:gamma-glutamyltranspeptidase/glutathione hydrolase